MSKQILVVDDDDNVRPALVKLLVACGFLAEGVGDGQAGLSRFVEASFDLVISDIRMPKLNGIELLQAIKKLPKTAPVILITGFSDLLETDEAFRMGADGFIPKPFKKNEILEAVQKCLKVEISAPVAESIEEYCKLNIDDFVSGKQLKYDIFIQIVNKYIKIAHNGEDLPPDRINHYKSKGLHFLYMKKEDFARYAGMNLSLLSAVSKNPHISTEKKMNLIKHTGEIILHKIHIEGLDEGTVSYAKTFVENIVVILGNNANAMDLLSALSSHTDFLYAHSVGVSMISVLIARKMGWVTISNLSKIAMAGLLHDIGEKEIDVTILSKFRKDLEISELNMIESHPTRGVEILEELKGMPSEVIQVVAQHHEDCAGLGYPRGIRKNQIHPVARLVSVASEFCDLVLDAPNSPKLSGKDAINRLLSFSAHKLDPDFLNTLGSIFQVMPPPSNSSQGSFGGGSGGGDADWLN